MWMGMVTEEDEDDAESSDHVPEAVESAFEMLLSALRDSDTVVRWAAAKGVGRLAARLPPALAAEVLTAVLELFAKGVAREGGMPDLVLWRLKVQEGSVDLFGEAMVVEVKGPRDRLSVRFFFRERERKIGRERGRTGEKKNSLTFLFLSLSTSKQNRTTSAHG